MAVSYKRLMHLLIELEISTKELQEKANISGNVLTRIRRNEYISLESVEAICTALNCSADDILEFGFTETDEEEANG